MALPEPNDEFETHRAEKPSVEGPERPDWLVGAEEGAQAEHDRDQGSGASAPVLKKPGVLPGTPPAAGAAASPQDEKPAAEKTKPWVAAASSIPTLRRRTEEPPIPLTQPEPPRGGGLPAGRAAPPAELPDAAIDDFPTDDIPSPMGVVAADHGKPAGTPSRTAVQPFKESWIAIAVDELRTNRRVQLGILVVLVLVAVWRFWPAETPSLPIARIHAEPNRYDGRNVKLSGQVGDVFTVGGGYAFYLIQKSDTIVVFTRSRVPRAREKVSVSGSISMGYLDGIARPALFEDTN